MKKHFEKKHCGKKCHFKFNEERIDAKVAEEMRVSVLADLRKISLEESVVFDLENVAYVSSPFLSLVIVSAKEIQGRGAAFSIKGANVEVFKLLKLVGIDKIAHIEPNSK
jgi:anti-anti-sigma factor